MTAPDTAPDCRETVSGFGKDSEPKSFYGEKTGWRRIRAECEKTGNGVTGYALRSIPSRELGKPLIDSARRKLAETDRLLRAFSKILPPGPTLLFLFIHLDTLMIQQTVIVEHRHHPNVEMNFDDIMADLEAIREAIVTGRDIDPLIRKRIDERAEKARGAVLKRHGVDDIDVPIIRELRDAE